MERRVFGGREEGGRCLRPEQSVFAVAKPHTNMMAHPSQIRFVDALPKTASGKILKRALRERGRAAVGARTG